MKNLFTPRLLLALQALFVAVLFCSCAHYQMPSPSQDPTHVNEMRWLYNANATEDANKAITQSDFRYVAVADFSRSLPGINNEEELALLANPNSYRLIEGTSDTPDGHEEDKLNMKAREYAKTYNLVIWEYLKKYK